MAQRAALQSTVEIELRSGPCRGQRRFRLSFAIDAEQRLYFSDALPIEGSGEGRVSLRLPDGTPLSCDAELCYDPEYPDRGSSARLIGLDKVGRETVSAYMAQRLGIRQQRTNEDQ
ncbi:MAG: hypothetical protein H6707_12850 [Deltaproteobacteria bacterium]|nr:hypothetical protein [Deltaproteobacteria bacterium]